MEVEKKMTCQSIIKELVSCLPDSKHEDDKSWGWAWETLGDDAQSTVKGVRALAYEWLKKYSVEENVAKPKVLNPK